MFFAKSASLFGSRVAQKTEFYLQPFARATQLANQRQRPEADS